MLPTVGSLNLRIESEMRRHWRFTCVFLVFAVFAVLTVGTGAQNCSSPRPKFHELFCGVVPSKPTLIIHPGDDFEKIISQAPDGSRILMEPGTYFISAEAQEPLRIPNDTTIWGAMDGEKRQVIWDGIRNNISAIRAVRPWDKNVRIYGIKFQNFALPGFEPGVEMNAVIDLRTQIWQDPFNMTNDPIYGFNEPNNYAVECCEFTKWAPQEDGNYYQISGIYSGSGCVIRGNYFHDGTGLAINAQARDVLVVQNVFKRISWPWKPSHSLGKYSAVKLYSAKNFSVISNKFEKIGGYAIWYDANSEDSVIDSNTGKEIGFGFVRIEACGQGFLVQNNWVRDFGVSDPRASSFQSPAFEARMAGGVLFSRGNPPRNLFRGNTAISGTKKYPISNRDGFSDRDVSARRKPGYDVSPPYGRLRAANGSGFPGQNWRWSDNNAFYANRAVGTFANGVSMENSRPEARTYLTAKWDCNILDGSFLYGTTLGSPPTKYMVNETRIFGLNTSPGVVNAFIPREAFSVTNRVSDRSLVIEKAQPLEAFRRVIWEVYTKECTDSHHWRSVGDTNFKNPVIVNGFCQCLSILIRARSRENRECTGSHWMLEVSLS